MEAKKLVYAKPEKVKLLANISEVNSNFSLCGTPEDSLVSLPEDQLLYVLSLLRKEVPEPLYISLSQWRYIISLLDGHMILPVIYRQIVSLPPDLRPPREILEDLRTNYMLSSIHAIKREHQLREILTAFAANAIEPLLLKGTALSFSHYPDPAMRLSLDIDLLVLPDQVLQCRNLLEGLGYECLEKRIESLGDGYCEEVFLPVKKAESRIPVEIHWGLYAFYDVNQHVDVKSLVSRAQKIQWSDLSFTMLDPIDVLIHSANHLIYNHGKGIRLNWVYDVSLLCQSLRSPDDWERLAKMSVDKGARLALEETMKLAQCWTGLNIPFGYDDFSTWPEPTDAEKRIFSMAADRNTITTFRMIVPRSASISTKLRLFYQLVFPSPELMRVYPKTGGKPLYQAYLIRWWELLKKL